MRSPWERAGKRTILRYFIFLHRSLSYRSFRLANNLRRNHLHAQPFKLRRDCMKILLPYVNIIFSIFFCFAYKIFAVTILNIIPLTERTFQSRMLTLGLACTWRFPFHEFYNFLPFNFLIFIIFWKTFFFYPRHLPTPTPTTHTHHPRPLPTTHGPRHLATLLLACLQLVPQTIEI